MARIQLTLLHKYIFPVVIDLREQYGLLIRRNGQASAAPNRRLRHHVDRPGAPRSEIAIQDLRIVGCRPALNIIDSIPAKRPVAPIAIAPARQ
jgi:hypothetical protein